MQFLVTTTTPKSLPPLPLNFKNRGRGGKQGRTAEMASVVIILPLLKHFSTKNMVRDLKLAKGFSKTCLQEWSRETFLREGPLLIIF